MAQSNPCAGCGRPVTEGTKVVVALVADDDYSNQSDMELGSVSAPCHPERSCMARVTEWLAHDRHLGKAIRAGRNGGMERLLVLAESG